MHWDLFIDRFVVIRSDDILIFNKSQKGHEDYLTQVFSTLMEQRLFINLKKCEFFVDKHVVLGYMVSAKGVKVDPIKVEAFRSWSEPKNI